MFEWTSASPLRVSIGDSLDTVLHIPLYSAYDIIHRFRNLLFFERNHTCVWCWCTYPRTTRDKHVCIYAFYTPTLCNVHCVQASDTVYKRKRYTIASKHLLSVSSFFSRIFMLVWYVSHIPSELYKRLPFVFHQYDVILDASNRLYVSLLWRGTRPNVKDSLDAVPNPIVCIIVQEY